MAIININEIVPGSLLKENLYHLESGKVLLRKWDTASADKLNILKLLKIESIFMGNSGLETTEFLRNINYKAIYADDLTIGQIFSVPLYDRNQRILIEAKVPINNSFLRLIAKMGGVAYRLKTENELNAKIVDEYFYKIDHPDSKTNEVVDYWEEDRHLSKIINLNAGAVPSDKISTLTKAEISKNNYEFSQSSELIAEGVKINSDFVDKDLTQRKKPTKVEISSDAVKLKLGIVDPLAKRTESYKTTFYSTYLDLIKDVSVLFKNISEHTSGRIDSQIKGICSRVVNTLIADKDLVINLTNLRSQNLNYLVQHSLNVAIYSINIGISMGYSDGQIFELTYGALLADIGFLKVDENLLTKKNKLTPEERRTVEKHPSYSLDYLNYIKGIPSSLPYIIYQSHEKLDGSGYPKGRPAFLVHEFAKVIAIADMFDSLCTARPWRSALTPYKAMEEIIRLAGQKKLDGKIIRQWLFSISLFPVGSYVNLNDSTVAKVISANPSDFMRPNLRAMVKNGSQLLEPLTLVLGENKNLKITRAVPQKEVQFTVLDGF